MSSEKTEAKEFRDNSVWTRVFIWVGVFFLAGLVKDGLNWYPDFGYEPLWLKIVEFVFLPLGQIFTSVVVMGFWLGILFLVYVLGAFLHGYNPVEIIVPIFFILLLVWAFASHFYLFLKAKRATFYALLSVLILMQFPAAYCEWWWHDATALVLPISNATHAVIGDSHSH